MPRCLIFAVCLLSTAPALAQNDWGVEWKGSTDSRTDEPATDGKPAPEADAPAEDPADRGAEAESETTDGAGDQAAAPADGTAGWGPMKAPVDPDGDAAEVQTQPPGETPKPEAKVDLSRPHRVMIAGAILVGASILVGAALGITADEVELGGLVLGGGISAGLVTLGAGAIVRRRRLLDAGYGEADERAARPLPRGPELRLTLRY